MCSCFDSKVCALSGNLATAVWVVGDKNIESIPSLT